MTKILILLTVFFNSFSANPEIEWDAIYTNATYALNHAKKAMESNNFDHQRFYSEKALESYDKIYKYLEEFEDEEFKLKIENTISDLEHAVDAPDWDRGRFYTKRVYQNTQELITTLDLRSAAEKPVEQPIKILPIDSTSVKQ
tara:strand:- start:14770 stop:15198 length:429 start_codon:yes stop_codon:yes gene_type:complete